jgi:hypothetical protein
MSGSASIPNLHPFVPRSFGSAVVFAAFVAFSLFGQVGQLKVQPSKSPDSSDGHTLLFYMTYTQEVIL